MKPLTQEEKDLISMKKEDLYKMTIEERRARSEKLAEILLGDRRTASEKIYDTAKIVGVFLLLIALGIGAYWAWAELMIYMGSEILRQGLQ